MARPMVVLFERGELTHVSVEPPTPTLKLTVRARLEEEFETFEPSMLGDVGARAEAEEVFRCLGDTAIVVGWHNVKTSDSAIVDH